MAGLALYRRLKGLERNVLRQAFERHQWLQNAALAVMAVIATPLRLFTSAALAGWFIRPKWLDEPTWEGAPNWLRWLRKTKSGDLITNIALYGATFMLGILLAGGVDWKGGAALGLFTYLSQIVAAWLVRWATLLILAVVRWLKHMASSVKAYGLRQALAACVTTWLMGIVAFVTRSRGDENQGDGDVESEGGNRGESKERTTDRISNRDTWHLGIAQQNGITAIVLSLNLEPVISGSVAVVSLAILVINTLHFLVNWVFDKRIDPRFWPVKAGDSATKPPGAVPPEQPSA